IAALLPVKELKAAATQEDTGEMEPVPEDTPPPPAGSDEELSEESEAVQVAAGPYIVFVTQNGLIKRTKLQAFPRPRPSGLKALSIEENDSLIAVMHANGDEDVIIGTAQGMAIRFDQKEVRHMGRAAFGVKGITLEAGDKVVGAELARAGTTLFTITEN